MMKRVIILILLTACANVAFATTYYVGGAGASDNNPGTTTQPFATIQKAASVAVAGDIVNIRSGTYRETIVPAHSGAPGNPITYRPDGGATVIISGLNTTEGGWSVHSGSIYKKSVTLPVNGWNTVTTNNTTLLANQIFKDGQMMFEARWPKLNSATDLMDKSKTRKMTTKTPNTITDAAIPNIPGGWAGGTIWMQGWYIVTTSPITAHSGSTITFSPGISDPRRYEYFYLTGKLAGLTQAKEWHYESGTLYFWQEGGGVPTGVEYKARNYGFDLTNRSYITIEGLEFFGCDPMHQSNTSGTNIVIDRIKAKYMNHAILNVYPGASFQNDIVYRNPQQTGIKLIGANSIIKNSELSYAASNCIHLGANCTAENNLIHDIGYNGNWGAGVMLHGQTSGNQKILRNTMYRLGRSAVDFGWHLNGQHLNVEIGYNDFYEYGMMSNDLGATYAGHFLLLTGTRIHHNWIHDSRVSQHSTGIDTGIYWDQGSGPSTIDHNVLWNNLQTDVYTQPTYQHKTNPPSNYYNNVFATNNDATWVNSHSYKASVPSPVDVQRNNIYRNDIIVMQGAVAPNLANSLLQNTDPHFVGSGQGGLAYRIRPTSPGVNNGVTLAGITDGSVGAPDIGAYEIGGTDWVPGYIPAPTTPNTPPVVSLTSPANNASFAQGAPMTFSATASDANGTITRVEFFCGSTKAGEDLTSPYSLVWSGAPAGSNVLTARATDNANSVTTSAPITVTVTGTNTAPTVSITGPSNNAQFTTGASITISATAADANGSVTQVEFFDGTTKLGEDLTSPYSFAWTNAAAGTHALTAIATDNDNSVTTSTTITITVVSPNTAPTVSITGPSNNAQFTTGASITISATAADANGSVTKVEFFDGATKLGEDLTSPYSFAWTNATAGTHALTAKATDNENSVTTSTTITIAVVSPNTAPTVSITAPSNNAQFTTGASIIISATAADANGSVTNVEFFDGTTKLGEDLTSPYSFAWTNATAGTHALTAKATDNENSVTTSTTITIAVVSPNTAPTVSITAPSNNAQFTTGASITISATASDANGSVTKVEFFDGTTKLGEDLTSPYSFTWANAIAGTHALTAIATDNDNSVITSTTVTIMVVSPNTAPTVLITGPSNNAHFTTGASITLTATASDANGSVTRVEFFSGTTKVGEDLTSPYSFVWNNAAAGTHVLTAKATDNASSVTTSTSVTITISANPAPTVAITGPSNNTQFTVGASVNIAATASDANGTVSKVEFFNGTTKLGEDVTTPYNYMWTNAPAGSHSISAKATDNQLAVATSQTVTIMVVPSNTPPVVSITSPASNSSFLTGSSITIAVNASDANGTITKVEFFRGTTKLGEDATSPYSFVWTNAPAGNHSLTAKATDNGAAETTSAAIPITVSTNAPPVVSLTSPTNNSSFAPGSSITLSATASDANGTVSKVEFYSGTTKLGEDATSPYSFVWNNVPAGSYSITAKATDNLNAVSTSTVVNISVVSTDLPIVSAGSDITLTLPDNTILLTGTGASGDGSSVSFQWTQVSGPNQSIVSDTSLPEVTLTNLIEGVYVFELTVTDAMGLSSKDQVNISVIGVSEAEALQSSIPRFFSPNDDGHGDFWEWEQPELFESSLLTVFTRSGQKIYEAVSYNNTWDGKVGDSPLQAGDYYYVVQLVNNSIIKGALQIIR